MNFLFDGNNFRGYGIESELIMKAYVNDYAAAITSEIFIREWKLSIEYVRSYKTETYDENLNFNIKEGLNWMHKKYGFKNKWSMQMFVKTFYDKFFENNKKLIEYKLWLIKS